MVLWFFYFEKQLKTRSRGLSTKKKHNVSHTLSLNAFSRCMLQRQPPPNCNLHSTRKCPPENHKTGTIFATICRQNIRHGHAQEDRIYSNESITKTTGWTRSDWSYFNDNLLQRVQRQTRRVPPSNKFDILPSL